jgi:hypothetical protein
MGLTAAAVGQRPTALHYVIDRLSKEALQSVRYLALDVENFWGGNLTNSFLGLSPLAQFRNLEKTIIVPKTEMGPGVLKAKYEKFPNKLIYQGHLFRLVPDLVEICPHYIDILAIIREDLEDMATDEHSYCCEPSCTHSSTWKVPKIELAGKIEDLEFQEIVRKKEFKAVEPETPIQQKGLIWLVKKWWKKLASMIFGTA